MPEFVVQVEKKVVGRITYTIDARDATEAVERALKRVRYEDNEVAYASGDWRVENGRGEDPPTVRVFERRTDDYLVPEGVDRGGSE